MRFILPIIFLLFNTFCFAELTLPKTSSAAKQPQIQQEQSPKNEDANKELHEATDKLHLRGVYNALLKGADINSVYNRQAPIHIAVSKQSADMIKYLIKCGADINIIDGAEFSPLMIAVDENNFEIVKLLLQNGADINTKIPDSGSIDVQTNGKTVYKYEYDEDLITRALKNENLEIAKYLIANGFKLNASNLSAALLNASMFNNIQAVKFIMSKGLKYKDFNMTPAIIVSIKSGYFPLVKYLISA